MITESCLKKIAAVLAAERAMCNTPEKLQRVHNITLSLADVFAHDNLKFKRSKFYAASGIER